MMHDTQSKEKTTSEVKNKNGRQEYLKGEEIGMKLKLSGLEFLTPLQF